jgi:hypothetical protein
MAKTIILNLADGSGSFQVLDTDITKIATDTLGAAVYYFEQADGIRKSVVVTDSPSSIATYSDTLISVLLSNSLTIYVNINRIRHIDTDPSDNYAVILYDNQGAGLEKLDTSETESAITVRQFQKAGSTAYEFDVVNATNDTISLASFESDKTSIFTNGVVVSMLGTNNDRILVVSSSSYNATTDVTTITFSTNIPTGTSETGYLLV